MFLFLCQAEPLVTFPVASPGFVQLQDAVFASDDGNGNGNGGSSHSAHLELSLMFRTGHKRGLLLYMADVPNRYYFLSLAMVDGGLELRVFPEYEVNTARVAAAVSKPATYNDNRWHTVSVYITETRIQFHVDDNEYMSINIANKAELLKLDERYGVYVGGLPDNDAKVHSDTGTVTSPFIGCVRDVLVSGQHLTDFNAVQRSEGIQLGVCQSEMPEDSGGKLTKYSLAQLYTYGPITFSLLFSADDMKEITSSRPKGGTLFFEISTLSRCELIFVQMTPTMPIPTLRLLDRGRTRTCGRSPARTPSRRPRATDSAVCPCRQNTTRTWTETRDSDSVSKIQ
jgi:hypothetical protein